MSRQWSAVRLLAADGRQLIMFRKSFKSKVILPTVLILVALTIVLTIYVLMVFWSYSNVLINEKIIANTNSLRLYVESSKKNSETAAVSAAYNTDIIKAVKNRDREEILQVLVSLLELYQVNFFTITDEQGIVLVRVHEPDNFGDSLFYQQNIKNAIAGRVSTYFETGTAIRVAARTGAPIYDTDGTLIGVVSTGIRFDTNEAVDQLKEQFHSDVTIFLGDTRLVTTITDQKGQRITGTKIDPNIARCVIQEKREYSGDTDIFNVKYKTFYMPLIDSQNKVFAVFFVGTPLSEIQTEAGVLIRNIIIISLIGLAVSIAILYSVISSISKPLLMLSKEMDNIAEGRLNIIVDIKNEDEIGGAARSLQKAVNIVHKLIDGINIAISEHEKGNTDYCFDTSPFQGDYRLLADRIMELSSLGMKDQLTGIPNRRSFNSRLNLEWHRAMRDKTPLSILMLDVDHFKAYNDTYGHQQGDVVLQTIARIMAVPLKRGFDFVARWGGEEFAVLLPNTDSAGALHVAEMIRSEIENGEIPCIQRGAAKKVTISIGVNTQIPAPNKSVTDLVAQADEALYQAKNTGRNRVCCHEGYEDDVIPSA